MTKVVIPEVQEFQIAPVKNQDASDRPIIVSIEEIKVADTENISYTVENSVNFTSTETNGNNNVQELILYVNDFPEQETKPEEYNSFDFVGIEEVEIENSNAESDSQHQSENERKSTNIEYLEIEPVDYSSNSDREEEISTKFVFKITWKFNK